MTDGEPETVVLASLQKKKIIKNPIKQFIFLFQESETSDSFVNHFDGHFAYLKTLDFYFKQSKSDRIYFILLYYNQNVVHYTSKPDLFPSCHLTHSHTLTVFCMVIKQLHQQK